MKTRSIVFMLALCVSLPECTPTVTYTKTPTPSILSPFKPDTSKPASEQISTALDISLCTVVDASSDARDMFNMLSSGSASTASKVFGGIMSGGGALAKALACYMKGLATQRAQASGEVGASARPDLEIITARAAPCDTASQSYKVDTCRNDQRKLASFLIMMQMRAGKITSPESQ